MGKIVAKVVLTGGPCAGKTSALSKIENYFTEKGYKVLIISESATELIKGGIKPFGDDKMDIELFQELIMKYQLQKEVLYEQSVLNFSENTKCIIVYDRGLLDNKAYINQEKFTKILKKQKLSELKLMDNYDMILHLVTAADGAEEYYTLGNNSARIETIEEARELDRKTINAWAGHPNLKVITNECDFETKLGKVVNEINNLIGEPVSIKRQRKYLLDLSSSDLSFLDEDNSTKIDITQYYLNATPKAETRVRVREYNGDKTYYLTVQLKGLKGKSSVLTEKKLSPKEFSKLLSKYKNADFVNKVRYSFAIDKIYYRLDLFQDGTAILEVEPSTELENIVIDDRLKIVEDVTDNPYYDNHVMASLRKSNKKRVKACC